jgi:hypothetical protein
MNQLFEACTMSRLGSSALPSARPCGERTIPTIPSAMAIATMTGPILPITSTRLESPNQAVRPTTAASAMPPMYFERP